VRPTAALIVESGRTRGALAAARALGASGWRVGVGSPSGRGLAASSRWASRSHVVPAPELDLQGFVEAVNDASEEARYDVVFGGGDAETLALSAQRAQIRPIVPHAPHERLVAGIDKLALTEAARRAGIATPRTEAIDAEGSYGGPLPAIVKARLHAPLLGSAGPARVEAGVVRDEATARAAIAAMREAGVEPIVQELVAGSLGALAVVVDREGQIAAAVQQVAERTWPAGVGISVRARSVDVDEALAGRVRELLGDLGWFGLAQLQFLVPLDGPPTLIDLNGRFYGSLALAVAAGVNLPAIWARLAAGEVAGAPGRAATGVRYQWLEGDLRYAASGAGGGRLAAGLDCLRYGRGAAHSVWSGEDPKPAAAALMGIPRRVIPRIRRGSAAR